MFDIKWIRDNPAAFRRRPQEARPAPLSAELIALDEARRGHVTKLQEAQARRNAASKEIGAAKAAKDEAKADALMAEVAALKDVLAKGEAAERELDGKLRDALSVIPNLPLDDVPLGKDEKDNKEVRKVGAPPKFDFKPKQHFEIGEALGLMDFATAAKISGARFAVLKGALGAARARARRLHARPAHDRVRLHREQRAAAGQGPRCLRHRQPAEVRGGPVWSSRGRRT